MCGIFGFVNETKNQKNNETILKNALDSVAHRGPDNAGYFIDQKNGVYLGHRRLSIIDLSFCANQPMFDKNKTVFLVFNGEIYNFLEIKTQLQKKGYVFQSKSDTEVVLNSYIEWGAECFKKFRGIFAVALFDKRNGSVVLARDHFGVKPVYYGLKNGHFIFSSEAKAFRCVGNEIFPIKINHKNLKLLLGFQYLPLNDQTIVEGLFKVPPAHYLVYKKGEIKLFRYWRLKENEVCKNMSFKNCAEFIAETLSEAVKMQMMSDVPVGIMLSGGLDSSLIAAIAKKYSQSIWTFTACFDNKIDERYYAKLASKHIKTNHREIVVDPSSAVKDIEKVIPFFDDLGTFDAGLITNKIISDKLREFGIKVILLGEGSDEIFGGYSWFGLSKPPFAFLPEKAKRFLYYYAVSRNINFSPSRYFRFLDGIFFEIRRAKEDFFRRISRFEIEYQLPNNYLMKVDKGTMAGSVEGRVPYLDFRLAELAFGAPSEFKLGGKFVSFSKVFEKKVLREIAKKYLPNEVAFRKKKGGMFPVSEFIKNNQKKIKDYILSPNSLSFQMFGKDKIKKLFEGDFNRIGSGNFNFFQVEREMFLWKLFLLEAWNNYFCGPIKNE